MMTKKRNSNLKLGAAKSGASPDAQNAAAPQGAGTAPTTDDNLYADITKSYTTGGHNGKMTTQIVATYTATKDAKTGAESFDTFDLTFTDVDNKVSSSIPDYAMTNMDWTTIPAPDDAADAEKFRPHGQVKIDSQMSGKMMRVNFNMGGDNTPTDIGYVFELNIPSDTKFAPKPPSGQGA